MRVGLWIDDTGRTATELAGDAAAAERAGLHRLWVSERDGWDALGLLAHLGTAAPRIGLGTSIVRTYPRHPRALAAQALSVQAVTGGRLTLGVGPSHGPIVEGQYGASFERPARHVREYLTALRPLLAGEELAYEGETLTAAGRISVTGATAPPVLVAAMGPHMLRVAGRLADGTVTTWAGLRTIEDVVRPGLDAAATDAGRPRPAVVAAVQLSVTDDPDGARAEVDERFGVARTLPAYAAVFERDGVDGPGGTVIAGDEAAVAAELERYVAAGVDEFEVITAGAAADRERTVAFLGTLASGG